MRFGQGQTVSWHGDVFDESDEIPTAEQTCRSWQRVGQRNWGDEILSISKSRGALPLWAPVQNRSHIARALDDILYPCSELSHQLTERLQVDFILAFRGNEVISPLRRIGRQVPEFLQPGRQSVSVYLQLVSPRMRSAAARTEP